MDLFEPTKTNIAVLTTFSLLFISAAIINCVLFYVNILPAQPTVIIGGSSAIIGCLCSVIDAMAFYFYHINKFEQPATSPKQQDYESDEHSRLLRYSPIEIEPDPTNDVDPSAYFRSNASVFVSVNKPS